MQFHYLHTPDVPEVPDSVKQLADWGSVQILINDPDKERQIVTGFHRWVEGSEQDIVEWLGPLKGVCMGEGPPMMQLFEVMHIKEPDGE